MKAIYLAAGKANLKNKPTIYQDKIIKRDINGDMLEIDLNPYEILIATPPCNAWSRSTNKNRYSKYAQETKNLLPEIIKRFLKTNKPFIVENVLNQKRYHEAKIDQLPIFITTIGRHTYFTNYIFSPKIKLPPENIKYMPSSKRQGAGKVNEVIDHYIEVVEEILKKGGNQNG